MRFKRFIILLSVFLILLLPVVWFSAPWWLSKVGALILAKQQCSDVVVDVGEIGLNKSHINRLYCKDKKGAFELELTDAEISYTISGLMHKRIEQVTLESAAIQLRPSLAASPKVIPILTTPALLLEALPLSSFHIRHIDLQRQNSAGAVLQELRGYAEYSDQGLSLVLNEDAYLKGLQLKVKMDKKNGVSAALYRGKNSILTIESTMHQTDDGISIDGIYDIKIAPLLVVLKPWLNMPDQQLKGKLHGSWKIFLLAQGSKSLLQQLNASTALELDFSLIKAESGLRGGKVNLDLIFKHGSGVWDITEKSRLSFGDKQKTTIDLSGLSGLFSRTESGWKGSVSKNSTLRVKNIFIDNMHISYANIRINTPVEIATGPKGSAKLVKAATVIATVPTLQWQGNSLSSRHLKLTILPGSILSPTGRFSAQGLRFTSATLQFPKTSISGTFAVISNQLSAKGELSAQDDRIHLSWTLNHQLARMKGVMGFSSRPVSFGADGVGLSRIIKHRGDYAIDNGSLAINGTLKWHEDKKTQQLRLSSLCELDLLNLKGHYNTTVFSGLGGKLLMTGDEIKVVMAPSKVTLNSLHAGLPITDISMSAAFTYPFDGFAKLEINQLKAEALGGQITSDKVAIDFARSSNPFLVHLQHIDAGKIAEIRDQKGLNIQGVLDGTLPFDWTQDGLKMTSGELMVPAGGLIRYLGTESVQKLASTDQATKMALDILKDFHYSQLKIGASYLPDGELKLSIKLKGKNPGYEQGRPIEFNFNIEENILKLLQALNVAGGVSNAVEKKVQKKLQKK